MRIATSQPTYIPWLGYLDLIDQVDNFVFLDTVQFEKRSWQQRNRIKIAGGLSFLTVPVVVKGRFEQRIKEVEIESIFFVRKHLRSIESSYRRAPYFSKYFQDFARILERGAAGTRLADLNIELIRWMCAATGIVTPLLRASNIDEAGCRSQRLVKICLELGATSYLSAPGSAPYLLAAIPDFAAAGIDVAFQHYEHPRYSQLFEPFLSHASALDLLFNEGERSLEILRSGRRARLRPEEVSVGPRVRASA